MNTEEIAKDMTEGPVFAAAGDICNTDCLGKCAAGYIQHGGYGGSRTGWSVPPVFLQWESVDSF